MWWLRGHALADDTSLPTALLFEYGHLWYLQSLLILFTGISLADAFFKPGTVGLVLSGLLAVMVSQSGIPMTTFFGVPGAFYLAPYFLFGIILRERPEWLRDRQSGVLALGIIVIVLTSQQLGMFGLTNPVTLLQLPAAIAGMAFVVLLLQRFPQYPLLSRVGHYSYTIYLWHVLAGAAVRDAASAHRHNHYPGPVSVHPRRRHRGAHCTLPFCPACSAAQRGGDRRPVDRSLAIVSVRCLPPDHQRLSVGAEDVVQVHGQHGERRPSKFITFRLSQMAAS